jgi:hypothetical protein
MHTELCCYCCCFGGIGATCQQPDRLGIAALGTIVAATLRYHDLRHRIIDRVSMEPEDGSRSNIVISVLQLTSHHCTETYRKKDVSRVHSTLFDSQGTVCIAPIDTANPLQYTNVCGSVALYPCHAQHA